MMFKLEVTADEVSISAGPHPSWEEVVSVSRDVAEKARGDVLACLRASSFDFRDFYPGAVLALDEEAAVRLVLIFRVAGDRTVAMAGVNAMSTEATFYWYTLSSSRRGLAALRVLVGADDV